MQPMTDNWAGNKAKEYHGKGWVDRSMLGGISRDTVFSYMSGNTLVRSYISSNILPLHSANELDFHSEERLFLTDSVYFHTWGCSFLLISSLQNIPHIVPLKISATHGLIEAMCKTPDICSQ